MRSKEGVPKVAVRNKEGGPHEWEERVRGPYCALPSPHERSLRLTCPSCPPGASLQETGIYPSLRRGKRHEQGWAVGEK